MSGEHASFTRLIPRSPNAVDVHTAVVQQAHEIDAAAQRDKAITGRLSSIETTQREHGVALGEIKLGMLGRDHELKKLAAILGLCGAIAAPLITITANILTRPAPAPTAIVAPPSAFDRAVTACNLIPDAAVRGKCVVDVAVANAR